MSVFEYGQFAGTRVDPSVVVERDCYGNPKSTPDACFDLVRDGACTGHKVVVIDCYAGPSETGEHGVMGPGAREALARKGFELVVWNGGRVQGDHRFPPSRAALQKQLETASQLWIISSRLGQLTQDLCEEAKAFYETGRGLFVLGDNDPFNVDANALLAKIWPGSSLSGSYCGEGTVLVLAGGEGSPGFHNHLITTGVDSMYEGHTIARVDAVGPGFQDLVTSSARTPVTAVYEKDGRRAIVDGGYTRLFMKWDTAGTDRFIVNVAAWLVNVERLRGPARRVPSASHFASGCRYSQALQAWHAMPGPGRRRSLCEVRA